MNVRLISWFVCMLSLAPCFQLPAETRNPGARVAIVDIETEEQDAVFQALADTITRTAVLVMELLGGYDVRRIPFLTPHYDLELATRYFQREEVSIALYGSIGRESDSYRIDLHAWQAGRDGPSVTVSNRIDSVFDVFDVGDASIIDLIEEVSGEELLFSELQLRNDGVDGTYSLYVNNRFVGSDLRSARILSGRRTVSVFRPGQFGEELVAETTLDFVPNETQVFSFVLEHATGDTGTEERRADSSPLGNLTIDVHPRDALIFVNEDQVGVGQVDFRRIEVGQYSIAVRHPGFLPLEDVAVVEAFGNTVIDRTLQIDPDSDIVRSYTIPTYYPSIVSGAITLAQLLVVGPLWIDDPSVLAFAPRTGHLIAGDPWTALGLSTLSAAGLGIVTYEPMSTVHIATGLTLALGSALYDIAMAGSAAERANRRIVEDLSSRETLQPRSREQLVGSYISAHVGYGVAMGMEWRFIEGYLGVGLLGGVGAGDRGLRASPIGQLRMRVTGHPTSALDLPVHPYASGTVVLASDFDIVEPYGAFGVGLSSFIGRLGFSAELPITIPFSMRRARPYIGVSWRVSP